jgi:hypothetical protein
MFPMIFGFVPVLPLENVPLFPCSALNGQLTEYLYANKLFIMFHLEVRFKKLEKVAS